QAEPGRKPAVEGSNVDEVGSRIRLVNLEMPKPPELHDDLWPVPPEQTGGKTQGGPGRVLVVRDLFAGGPIAGPEGFLDEGDGSRGTVQTGHSDPLRVDGRAYLFDVA